MRVPRGRPLVWFKLARQLLVLLRQLRPSGVETLVSTSFKSIGSTAFKLSKSLVFNLAIAAACASTVARDTHTVKDTATGAATRSQ